MIDIIDVESDSVEIEEEYATDLSEIDLKDSINKTFNNPSQENTPCGNLFCEKCEFEAKTKTDLKNHKKETHNWCPFCFSSFNCQDKLNDHINNDHTEWVETTGLSQEGVLDKHNICFWLDPCVSFN